MSSKGRRMTYSCVHVAQLTVAVVVGYCTKSSLTELLTVLVSHHSATCSMHIMEWPSNDDPRNNQLILLPSVYLYYHRYLYPLHGAHSGSPLLVSCDCSRNTDTCPISSGDIHTIILYAGINVGLTQAHSNYTSKRIFVVYMANTTVCLTHHGINANSQIPICNSQLQILNSQTIIGSRQRAHMQG